MLRGVHSTFEPANIRMIRALRREREWLLSGLEIIVRTIQSIPALMSGESSGQAHSNIDTMISRFSRQLFHSKEYEKAQERAVDLLESESKRVYGITNYGGKDVSKLGRVSADSVSFVSPDERRRIAIARKKQKLKEQAQEAEPPAPDER